MIARRARLEDDDSATALREARELDDRLGLTPKGLAALRWTIVEVDESPAVLADPKVSSLKDRRDKLTRAS